jgi:hypothetical protein
MYFSVYLNVDQSQRANLNRGFETQLKEMASSLRKSLQEKLERDPSLPYWPNDPFRPAGGFLR